MAGAAPRGRRLFFALWPSDEFRVQVQAASLAIAQATGGRLIPPRNYHVTLLFLGDVPSDRLAAVQDVGARLAGSSAFELSFDGVEAWGRKLLCLTASTVPAAATDLATRLRSNLSSHLARPDDHGFRPHVTLARNLARGWRTDKIQPLRQEVADFALVESERDAAASHYSVLERWPLL